MKQQTAVEWLINEMHKKEEGLISISYNHLFDKAIKMEKNQIEKAVVFGNRQDFYDGTEEIGSDYFNNIYTQSSE